MKCLIELWNAKDAWKRLSKADRKAYLAQISPYIQEITKQGVEIGSWGVNTITTSHRVGFDFFAVWKFPNQEMVFVSCLGVVPWIALMSQ